jgi:hypothetical protein
MTRIIILERMNNAQLSNQQMMRANLQKQAITFLIIAFHTKPPYFHTKLRTLPRNTIAYNVGYGIHHVWKDPAYFLLPDGLCRGIK